MKLKEIIRALINLSEEEKSELNKMFGDTEEATEETTQTESENTDNTEQTEEAEETEQTEQAVETEEPTEEPEEVEEVEEATEETEQTEEPTEPPADGEQETSEQETVEVDEMPPDEEIPPMGEAVQADDGGELPVDYTSVIDGLNAKISALEAENNQLKAKTEAAFGLTSKPSMRVKANPLYDDASDISFKKIY